MSQLWRRHGFCSLSTRSVAAAVCQIGRGAVDERMHGDRSCTACVCVCVCGKGAPAAISTRRACAWPSQAAVCAAVSPHSLVASTSTPAATNALHPPHGTCRAHATRDSCGRRFGNVAQAQSAILTERSCHRHLQPNERSPWSPPALLTHPRRSSSPIAAASRKRSTLCDRSQPRFRAAASARGRPRNALCLARSLARQPRGRPSLAPASAHAAASRA
jgi:hypothetical protein